MVNKFDHHLIVSILTKYALWEPLTDREKLVLSEWMALSDENRRMPDELRSPDWRDQHRRDLESCPTERMWKNIRRYIKERKKYDPLFIRHRQYRNGWLCSVIVLAILIVVLLI